jgi:hypothetical protein
MKRSDVLLLIHDVIIDYSSEGEIILTSKIEREMTEKILRAIEEVGMLPPSCKKLVGPLNGYPGHEEVYVKRSVHEWENE